nr:hypothetical protein [Tanacetum cinerariifolium]
MAGKGNKYNVMDAPNGLGNGLTFGGINSGSVASAAEEFVSSSVTPTLEHDYEDESTNSDNVILPVSSMQAHVNLVTTEPADEIRDSSVLGIEVGGPSVPKNETGFSSATPNRPPCNLSEFARSCYSSWVMSYWAALHDQSNAGFLDSFNINSAQHACMVFDLRLSYKHKIMSRDRFEKKFTDSSMVIQQKDAEIADLKSMLEKAESKAAGVGKFQKRVSNLELEATTKASEIAGLNAQNAKLLRKIYVLESVRRELNSQVAKLGADCEGLGGKIAGEARMREEFTSLQETMAWRFEEQATELDAHIAKVKRDMDTDRYPHIKVISLAINKGIQQGLKARVEHEKAGRSLTQVEAYAADVENKSCSVSTDILLYDAIATLCGRAERRKVVIPSSVVASGSSKDNTLAIAYYHISSLTLTDDAVPVT